MALYSKTNNFRIIFLILTLVSVFTLLLILPVRYSERIEKTSLSTFKNIIKQKSFVYVCISLIVVAGSQITISSWLPALLQNNLGMDPKVSNYSLSIFWFTVILGRIITAYLSRKISIVRLIKIQIGLVSVILIVSGFVKNYYFIITSYLLFGIVTGGLQPLLIAMTLTRYRKNNGIRLGLIYSNASLGILLIPTIVGIFGDNFPFYRVISFISILFLALLVLFRRIPE